jgi:hypothetical protein
MADDVSKLLADYYMANVDSNESKFNDWFKPVAQKMDLNQDPYDPGAYYDYRGFYDAMNRGEAEPPDAPGGHWPSQFKSDDHPRAYLLYPVSGRYFDTKSGAYTDDGGMVEEDRMNQLNGMDLPDLSREEWLAAKGGARGPKQ